MDISWAARKAVENLLKHGVDFADAVIALEDVNALTIEDNDHDEQRFKTLGIGPRLNILFVVYAFHNNDSISIISARKATRNETEQYYDGINYE